MYFYPVKTPDDYRLCTFDSLVLLSQIPPNKSDHCISDMTYKIFLNIFIWGFKKCHTIIKTPELK